MADEPDPWCTSPDPQPAPEPIVVQADVSELEELEGS